MLYNQNTHNDIFIKDWGKKKNVHARLYFCMCFIFYDTLVFFFFFDDSEKILIAIFNINEKLFSWVAKF
jgi:hypothetical protein